MEEIKTGVFKITNNNPIFIIGDIHGDYQVLIHCLVDLCQVTKISKIISDEKFNEPKREYLEWIESNNSIVIFCGDLIHRKRFQNTILDDECSDIFIIETLLRLKKNAKKYNGDIIIISGNHEIMNIIEPSNSIYTSEKNLETNLKYFCNDSFINNFISNSYAWIKLNDILIAHGGLCSDYLKFLDNENIFENKLFGGSKKNKKKNISHMIYGGDIVELGDDVINFVNNKYKNFFTNYSKSKSKTDLIGHKLFIEYDLNNKHKHNIFWCREWGYSGVNCDNFHDIVNKVGCDKMIIAHCPQFLANDKPKMINFECVDITKSNNLVNKFKIARIDLGMSRCFDYNKHDDFFKFLMYNYNRKMSVLKLSYDHESHNYFFNYDSIITKKISCIQYLLLKYGIKKKDWEDKNIYSNWIGFQYIDRILHQIELDKNDSLNKKCNDFSHDLNESTNIILCLLYPIYFSKPELPSVNQFLSLLQK